MNWRDKELSEMTETELCDLYLESVDNDDSVTCENVWRERILRKYQHTEEQQQKGES